MQCTQGFKTKLLIKSHVCIYALLETKVTQSKLIARSSDFVSHIKAVLITYWCQYFFLLILHILYTYSRNLTY